MPLAGDSNGKGTSITRSKTSSRRCHCSSRPTPPSSKANPHGPPRSCHSRRVNWGRGWSRSIGIGPAWSTRATGGTWLVPEVRAVDADLGVPSHGHHPLDPRVERTDVVLARHEHAAVGVDPRAHRGLAPLARVEVLHVDPVEQLDRGG